MCAKKKEEANDIVQYLLPQLVAVGITNKQCKVDTATDASGNLRGDIWISRKDQSTSGFEKNIVGLIEAKHHNCSIGDIDWRDAIEQGKNKGKKQGLSFYIVTNCTDSFRFYNIFNDDEITLDGTVITKFQPIDVLEKIQAQISKDNSQVFHQIVPGISPVSEDKFRKSLAKLADIYRSCGLKKGDDRIDPTASFVILKYIGEKEKIRRTLSPVVKIWPDYGTGKGNYKADFTQSCKDIFNGEYGDAYKDFKELVFFPNQLANDHYKRIWEELNQYHFHGCSFDVFGAIYEEFASQMKKREFGEFYTRRHITGIAARLLLRNEVTGRKLKIGDPACGSGGFLTEAYKTLKTNYAVNGKLNATIQSQLEKETFWGFDNDEKSVARTQLNMFLVGDGHTHICHIKDSLTDWMPDIGWTESTFDYNLANPPMGAYGGEADINNFQFTNERRCELLFAERIIRATKEGGEIVIVVPDGMLEAPSREGFRKKLLETCDINAIISLTRFAFAPYTKEKTYLIFMRKKQKEQVGVIQMSPIWHYIVDYDGFANSDKRYKTKWHTDLPELEDKFPKALQYAQLAITDKATFDTKRTEVERAINSKEQLAGFRGQKCGYVSIDKMTGKNFFNLLSEFYLRPLVMPKLAENEFNKQYTECINLFKKEGYSDEIIRRCYDLKNRKIAYKDAKLEVIADIFDATGGNSGLTEEFIYANQPVSKQDMVEILTGATQEENKMGYVSSKCKLPSGDSLKIFEGECVLVARKGYAGTMVYVNRRFTTNDDVYVFTLKPEWKGKINLHWFIAMVQTDFWNVVTSKSDNATFNKEWLSRLTIDKPEKNSQDLTIKKIQSLDDILELADMKVVSTRLSANLGWGLQQTLPM